MKKIKWRWDMGAYVRQRDSKPEEFAAYNEYVDACKREVKEMIREVEYVEGKHKPTIVEEGEYTIVQSTNNHIQIYKDGRMVMHMSCRKKKTEDELRSIIEMYELLCRKGADNERA